MQDKIAMEGSHWLRLEDPLQIKQFLTVPGLMFASSLVVEAVPLSTSAYVPDAEYRFAVDLARVTRVFKSSYGPDSTVSPGSLIYVADPQLEDGSEWADDPAIKPGQPYVFFLDDASNAGLKRMQVPVYQLTSDWVSKWRLDASSRVHVPGIALSRIKDEVEGQPLSSVLQVSSVPSNSSEQLRTGDLLLERGVSSPMERAQYQSALQTHPGSVLREAVRFDKLHTPRGSRVWRDLHTLPLRRSY